MAGYSGTPLPRKLGLAPGQRLAFINPPDTLPELLGALPDDARVLDADATEIDLALLFVRQSEELDPGFHEVSKRLSAKGMLWVAWPKKASGYRTDLTEDVVREVGLGDGLVDVKVCAIDDFWSGLKFLHRRQPRKETEI
jgi:hypothetical protein